MKKNLFRVGVIIFSFIMFSLSFSGCKSKQKIAQDQSESAYAQKIEQAKRDLLAIINDQGSMNLDEKEYRLNAIKQEYFQDQEVKDLIARADDALTVLRDEQDAKTREESEKQQQYVFHKSILDGFNAVASANSFSQANLHIAQALKLYASGDIPVLIIISQENGVKDYDRPTTIKKYLEYLKDVKKFDKGIESFMLDNNGKITEIELIKK